MQVFWPTSESCFGTHELGSKVWGEKGKVEEQTGARRWESEERGHEELAVTPAEPTLRMHSRAAS